VAEQETDSIHGEFPPTGGAAMGCPSGFVTIVLVILALHVTWMGAAFFMGALWRSLPSRYGPTKAFFMAIVFSIPVCTHWVLGDLIGQEVRGTIVVIVTSIRCPLPLWYSC
jgi:hypothetical protein